MYENKTPEAIKAEILASIAPETGLSAMAGGFADAMAGPVSEQMSQLYMSLDALPYMLFPDETSGEWIARVGEQYWGIHRRAGTRASAVLHLTGAAGTEIPAGTVFLTAGGLEFALRTRVLLPAGGKADGTAEAAAEGSVYNVDAGALVRMYVNLPGLTAYANEAAAGGTDAESDAALLQRIRERVRRPPTSGNGYQYQQWALETEGVGWAKVVELSQGPGTVGITLVDSNGKAAAEGIITAARARIEAERPIGAGVTVAAARERKITVTAQVTVSGVSTEQVREALVSELDTYRRTLIDAKYRTIYYSPEEDRPYTLRYNRVLAILLNIEGVEDFSVLTVDGGTADLTIEAGDIPVLGEVSVT